MKKIALITTNKILGESLDAAIKAIPNLNFQLLLFFNKQQALLDAEVFQIDVALIDIIDSNTEKKEDPYLFCEKLHERMPNCHLLLLVSQDDKISRKMATEAKKKEIVEDFVFYDASLKYLLAKLEAF